MFPKPFRSIKPEIRVLGIDDGTFVPHTKGTVDIVGVVYRGAYLFEGVMKTKITIDGLDATENFALMIKNSPYYGEIRVVFLNGITFGGFNVVDIRKLFTLIGLPVVTVVEENPNLDEIKAALLNLPDFDVRWNAIQNVGELFEVEVKPGLKPVYLQVAGISCEDAQKILKKTLTIAKIPEALRVAHIIASGLSQIQSKDLND
ncbi:MAG: DUF99 family protein [Candidatus Bathyarchaeota archaeon]|nr:DUF99 family protein [Candidatus Bathyarchaeum tardum]WGM89640.1 MAG: DUF99 family protein [Candidatus Bathyarchaeum tardum]